MKTNNDFIQVIVKPLVKYFINLLRFRKGCNKPVNLLKTLYVNFACLPSLKQAIKLPILVYNGTELYKIGKIRIDCPIQFGMIKLGDNDFKVHGRGKLLNNGLIVFGGPVEILGGFIIENNGVICLGGYIVIGSGTRFIIRNKLEIKEYVRIGFNCFFMDTDDHYMINVIDKCVHRFSSPITIGRYNWVGAHTYCKKGVKLPDYTIVASANTLLTKDYSALEPYCVLAGSPAKIIAKNVRRIYNMKEQCRLMEHFKNTLEKKVIVDVENMEEYCLSNFFSLK
jgi:acetyltransferase-like isoleucine patch superfamily enzyme